MGKHKSVILITTAALAILPTLLVFAQKSADKKIEFSIGLEKETFVVLEPIWVDLYFTNKGNENVTLDCLDLCWQRLQVHVVNSEGDTSEYCGYITDGICRAGATVKPSETYHYYFNLSENFGQGAREHLPPYLRYFAENIYTLQMVHTGISSNLVKFEVKFPKGEEGLAYNLVKQGSRSGFRYYYKDAQQVLAIFQELISKYPKSSYADLAYYEAAGLYGVLGQPEKTYEHLRSLVLKHPNSHFGLKALPGLLGQMTQDEKMKFLKEIIEKQPKTKASHWAKESLKALEEQEEKEK
jgi:tetratricopeptide (TPR) repeat protein